MTREYDLETDCEVLWTKINIVGSKTLHLGSYYRSDVADNTSLGELANSLARIPMHHSVLLGGDFNLPDFDWNSCTLKTGRKFPEHHNQLLEIFQNFGLTQHVTETTRTDPFHGTENTLDLIATNRPNSVISTKVIPGIADHDAPIVELDIKPVRVTKKPRNVPLYRSAKWEDFQQYITDNCSDILSAPDDADVNQLWAKFGDVIRDGTQKFIPHRRQKSRVGLPYITSELRKLMRKRDRLYDKIKRARRNVTHHDRADALKSRYKKLKQDIQRRLRTAYWGYIASVITPPDETQPPKKAFWSFVKRNRTENLNISALKDLETGNLVTDSIGKAKILNSQFQSVFTDETPLTDDHKSPQEFPDINDIHFTEPGVLKLLLNLDPSKATGPDQISPRVLKELAPSISPVLTVIFNRSYQSGIVPDDWRDANVVPAYKKGKKMLAVNYRPISLTCICCKLFEHVMVHNIMKHAQEHKILYAHQHGFRSMLSCETQLTEFYHDLVSNCHGGHQTDALVMDFSKAFDKVGHERLLEKITRYGITGHTQRWIRQFLSDRKQRVVLDGEQSDTVPVTSGVPQGSVLGPCLFLLYINDLAQGLDSTVRLFADDTIAYLVIGDTADAARLQQDLDRLAHWEDTWQMQFHPEKCQVLRVTKKTKANVISASYTLHGHTLEVVNHVKYLGVTLSGDLKWDKHVSNVVNKANSILAVLKRNVRVPSQAVKSAAYTALVRPHLEYCSSVWDPHTKKLKDKIEMVQRRSARWVMGKYRWGPDTTGPTSMMRDLNWPTLVARRRVTRLCLMYKMANRLVLMSYCSLLTPHPYPLKSLLNPHAFIPLERMPEKLYYTTSFFPSTVLEWNILPESVFPQKPSPEDFKSSVWEEAP